MKYLIKHPGLAPETDEIPRITLKTLQTAVGGLIESVYVPELSDHGIDTFANEEGLFERLPPNVGFMIEGYPRILVGSLIFASSNDEGDTVGLTDDQAERVEAFCASAQKDLPAIMVEVFG